MRLTPSLLGKLHASFPEITFEAADEFLWSPEKTTVFYNPADDHAPALLLHEVGHAALQHRTYNRDIQLLAMETAAWTKAGEIAKKLRIPLSDTAIQNHLDTYREWLHQRSTCPHCQAIGHQITGISYRCVVCGGEWTVNEARTCQLRRYRTTQRAPQ